MPSRTSHIQKMGPSDEIGQKEWLKNPASKFFLLHHLIHHQEPWLPAQQSINSESFLNETHAEHGRMWMPKQDQSLMNSLIQSTI